MAKGNSNSSTWGCWRHGSQCGDLPTMAGSQCDDLPTMADSRCGDLPTIAWQSVRWLTDDGLAVGALTYGRWPGSRRCDLPTMAWQSARWLTDDGLAVGTVTYLRWPGSRRGWRSAQGGRKLRQTRKSCWSLTRPRDTDTTPGGEKHTKVITPGGGAYKGYLTLGEHTNKYIKYISLART